MRKVRGRRSRRLVTLVVVLFALAGGIAYATIADGGGVIHGCYKTQNGQLRVVPAGESCLSSEQAIQWNQGGPTGPAFISFTESGDNGGPLPNVVLVGTRNSGAVLADGIDFSIHADC